MRRIYASLLPLAALISLACTSKAQNESARQVRGGGISVQRLVRTDRPQRGERDSSSRTISSLRTATRCTSRTGPAVAYWNPRNTASHDYTVKATFTEPKYMNLNDHPHAYGVFSCGNDHGDPTRVSL